MRLHFTVLTILACSALSACAGGQGSAERERAPAERERASAERERLADFPVAADEVCREHNARIEKLRDRVRGRQISLEEAVDVVDDEAQVKEGQIQALRALDPPPDAKPYLRRLRRNAAGIRRSARQLEADRGESYDQFWTTMQNSEGAANKEAEALGLRDCSPPLT